MIGRSPTARLAHCTLVALAAAAAACGDDDATAPDVPVPNTIEIEPATATLTAVGEIVRLSASVLDQHGETMAGLPVEWESLDASVATVTDAGTVVAVGAGSASIEARIGSVGELATVTVAPVPTSVAIEPGADTLHAIGDTTVLTATVHDPNGVAIEDAVVDWASTDSSVATVDGAGRVVAAAPGTATISATAGETSVEAEIVVRQVAAGMAVDPVSLTLAEDAGEQLSATVVDSNGVAVAGAAVAWSADDTMTATVDGDGFATGVFQGTTTVTASSGDVAATAAIRVLGRISYTAIVDTTAAFGFATLVMNADGTGVEQLDFLADSDRDISWSPDGARIAFASNRSGDTDIWVANADGSGTPINLTADTMVEASPDWSPDGERVVYRARGSADTDLFIANADGSGTPVRLTDNTVADNWPAWSPDGLTIAFAHVRETHGVFQIHAIQPDPNLGVPYPLTPLDTEHSQIDPAWSPDGRRIAFIGDRGGGGHTDVFVIEADGTDMRRLTDTPAREDAPSWSWDGRRIVFISLRDGNEEIYTVDVETGETVRLTRTLRVEGLPRYLPRGAP